MQVLPAVLEGLGRPGRQAGVLVGLPGQGGDLPLVTAALHCEADDLEATRGAGGAWLSGAPRQRRAPPSPVLPRP